MDRFQAMTTFVRVVDAGSFSGAARRLNIGQPAVSKTIAQLEERLQVRLLTRSTRGLTPTEAGQRFYERARRSIEEAEEAELAARGEGRGFGGLLRVSAPVTFSAIHLIPRLPVFLATHPQLEVELILDDRLVDLVEEGVDLALRLGTLADSAVTARRIASAPRLVLAAPTYLARRGEPQTPKHLEAHEAILQTSNRAVPVSFAGPDGTVSVTLRGRVRVSGAEGVRAAALAGMGIAVASEWMFAPELASGAVRRLLPGWTLDPVDLWALFPTGRLASAKARAFAAFVETTLRAGPPPALPH